MRPNDRPQYASIARLAAETRPSTSVRSAAVVAWPDEDDLIKPKAFVVLKSADKACEELARDAVRLLRALLLQALRQTLDKRDKDRQNTLSAAAVESSRRDQGDLHACPLCNRSDSCCSSCALSLSCNRRP